jgi:hypothetical protein
MNLSTTQIADEARCSEERRGEVRRGVMLAGELGFCVFFFSDLSDLWLRVCLVIGTVFESKKRWAWVEKILFGN